MRFGPPKFQAWLWCTGAVRVSCVAVLVARSQHPPRAALYCSCSRLLIPVLFPPGVARPRGRALGHQRLRVPAAEPRHAFHRRTQVRAYCRHCFLAFRAGSVGAALAAPCWLACICSMLACVRVASAWQRQLRLSYVLMSPYVVVAFSRNQAQVHRPGRALEPDAGAAGGSTDRRACICLVGCVRCSCSFDANLPLLKSGSSFVSRTRTRCNPTRKSSPPLCCLRERSSVRPQFLLRTAPFRFRSSLLCPPCDQLARRAANLTSWRRWLQVTTATRSSPARLAATKKRCARFLLCGCCHCSGFALIRCQRSHWRWHGLPVSCNALVHRLCCECRHRWSRRCSSVRERTCRVRTARPAALRRRRGSASVSSAVRSAWCSSAEDC